MYQYIFYFFYRTQLNQKDFEPRTARIIGGILVFIVVWFHVGLLYSIIRYILFNYYDVDISFSVGQRHNQKVAFWYPIIITVLILCCRYFTAERAEPIIKKYVDKEPFFNVRRVLLVLSIYFIPLIISIILNNHSQKS